MKRKKSRVENVGVQVLQHRHLLPNSPLRQEKPSHPFFGGMRLQFSLLLPPTNHQHAPSTLMAFPLPEDPNYRKLVVTFWLDDIDDRLEINQVQDAEKSWKIANEIYLSLPPGSGDPDIENWIFQQRVKLDKRFDTTNANN